MSISTFNDDVRVSQIIQELTHVRQPTSEVHLGSEDAALYQILDEAEHGRKLMNYLGYAKSITKTLDYNHSAIRSASLSIGESWLRKEKRASTQTTPAALQLETPVIFSWSKKVNGARKDQYKDKDLQNSSQAPETTNNALYRKVAATLEQLRAQQEWDEPLRPSTNDDDGSLSQRSQWAGSSFKVDPLQPFVARLVKEPKKKAPRKEKSPSKMRNLFNFLNSGKKSKAESTENEPKTQDDTLNALEDSQELDVPTVIEEPATTGIGISKQASLPNSQNNSEGRPLEAHTAPPKLSTSPSLESDSPLSMNSFVPLKPKKRI